MIYVGIDPGPAESTIVYLQDGKVIKKFFGSNAAVKEMIWNSSTLEHTSYNCEMIASYGMAVGKSVFETCLYIGEVKEFIRCRMTAILNLRYRKDIKMAFCGTCRAKDKNIRQYLIDRFPPTGDGKCPQIGTKKRPGPLFGVSSHTWAALAVALYAADLDKQNG